MVRFFRACFLLLLIVLAWAAQGESESWKREVLREERPGGRTLLLVIDTPSARGQLPRLVYRRSFGSSERDELVRIDESFRKSRIQSFSQIATDAVVKTPNPLWKHTREWTAEFEAKFNQWVKTHATESFMEGTGVDIDCADLAMAYRWIFARENELPAANHLAGGGDLFGSWESTQKWDKLPTHADWRRDERFKAALKYLLAMSYTHSFIHDLYPVAINHEFASTGTVYITLYRGSGHTRVILGVGKSPDCWDSSSCITVIYGNEPASELSFVANLIPNRLERKEGGFMRFRWPVRSPDGIWSLANVEHLPGYSEEQYQWSEEVFLAEVSTRLNLWNSTQERFLKVGEAAIKALRERVSIVERGYFLCSVLPCKRGDALFEEWSTPQRDHQLRSVIASYENAKRFVDLTDPAVISFERAHVQELIPGSGLKEIDALVPGAVQRFGSDPSLEFEARWGLQNSTLESKLLTRARVLAGNWSWRESLVNAAQQLCFPNGEAQATCSESDPAVSKLSTSRLDEAIRVFRRKFLQELAQATQNARKEIQQALLDHPTQAPGCDGRACSLGDLFFGNSDRLEKMTSNPRDNVDKRFGLTQPMKP